MDKGWVFFAIVCVLVGVWLGGLEGPAYGQGRPPTPAPGWPPKPSEIVNLDGELKISKDEAFTIFEVPAGRTLVVTDFSIIGGTGSTWKAPSLVEKVGKTRIVKRNFRHALFSHDDVLARPPHQHVMPQQYHSVVGLTFAPFTKVQLVTEMGATRWYYNLTGYLAPSR